MPLTEEQRELEVDLRERRKLPGETDLQWRTRIAQLDQDKRLENGEPVSAFTEQHGEYEPVFVMHVETGTLHHTKRHKGQSALFRMHQNGTLDNDQFVAAQTIMFIHEMIKRGADVKCASLEARVDNGGGNRDASYEALKQVRAEMAYTIWRKRLPAPRPLVLEMLTAPRPMSATARKYKMGWRKARERFVRSLDEFARIHREVTKVVKNEDILRAHDGLAD